MSGHADDSVYSLALWSACPCRPAARRCGAVSAARQSWLHVLTGRVCRAGLTRPVFMAGRSAVDGLARQLVSRRPRSGHGGAVQPQPRREPAATHQRGCPANTGRRLRLSRRVHTMWEYLRSPLSLFGTYVLHTVFGVCLVGTIRRLITWCPMYVRRWVQRGG